MVVGGVTLKTEGERVGEHINNKSNRAIVDASSECCRRVV